MEVQYATSKLEKRCTSGTEMRKQYSAVVVKSLKLRLLQLYEAGNAQELFAEPGKWHPLGGNLKGFIAGRLTANWRIIIRGIGAEDEVFDWARVEVVRVEEISDYH